MNITNLEENNLKNAKKQLLFLFNVANYKQCRNFFGYMKSHYLDDTDLSN